MFLREEQLPGRFFRAPLVHRDQLPGPHVCRQEAYGRNGERPRSRPKARRIMEVKMLTTAPAGIGCTVIVCVPDESAKADLMGIPGSLVFSSAARASTDVLTPIVTRPGNKVWKPSSQRHSKTEKKDTHRRQARLPRESQHSSPLADDKRQQHKPASSHDQCQAENHSQTEDLSACPVRLFAIRRMLNCACERVEPYPDTKAQQIQHSRAYSGHP